MRLVVFFLFIFSVNISFSQDQKLDSLITSLNSYQSKDTVRIKKLVAISNHLFLNDIDKATPYFKEAIDIAKHLNEYKRVSGLKTRFAENYVTRGLFKEALNEILSAVNILDSISAPIEDQIFTQNILSKVYRSYGDNKKSLDVILNVIELSKQRPLNMETPKYYYNASQTYLELKNYSKAEECLYKALELAKELKNEHLQVVMTSLIGDYYKNIKEYDKAKNMTLKSIPYYQEKKYTRNIASSYRILANIESLQGNHKASIPYYEKALKIFDEIGDLYYSKIVNQNLFIAYSIIQNQDKANAANQRYNKLKDSLDSKERKSLIAEMNTKFETEKIKKEKEIAELSSAKSNNLFIGSVVVACLILLSSLFYFGKLKARKKAELVTLELKETQKRLAIEKQYRDSELKALKAQMDPHFIFNTLNSIQEYIILNQKNLASSYLGKFASLMRKYLYHSDKGFISLKEEIDCLNIYLELEKVRFEDTLKYTIEVNNNLEAEHISIPTMIIQPYVENALKHGLLHKKDNRVLNVNFKKDNKYIICCIEDNGVGRKKSKEIQANRINIHQSFATKATENRLELLNFGRDSKIGVETIDLFAEDKSPKGTKVIITIPIIENSI